MFLDSPVKPGNDTRGKTRLSRSVNEEGRSVVSRPAAIRAWDSSPHASNVAKLVLSLAH